MSEHNVRKAVVYCRVSTVKQTTRGDGLASQETRCREYARYKGYDVVHVFKDDMSGSLVQRPGLQALLTFLRKHRRDPHVVIIDDISRLARGLEAHLKLRAALGEAGGILESPSIEFGEDSDSILVENLLASVSQHQRQKNGEQTRNRMRARVMNGYWVFKAPVGYRFERVAGHNKMLVRDEPLASIVQEALEGFADGRFQIQAEVKRFLETFPNYPRAARGEVRYQQVTELLTRIAYAGYVEAPDWGIGPREGRHAPLISFETYRRIQDRLNEAARVPARKNINADFPLRGFVTCGDCNSPLTGCWSKGRTAHYPYYQCFGKGCPSYGKTIPRARLEGEFEQLLDALMPSQSLFTVARLMFEELWNHRLGMQQSYAQSFQAELTKTERKISQLFDRIVETDSRELVTAYEGRVRALERQKAELAEKIAACCRPLKSFDEGFRTAMTFLGSPRKIWNSERLEDKRAVLKLAFAERLAYRRNEGFRTAVTAFPFRLLRSINTGENKMASPRGFEPLLPP